jgi:serine O-acetyltransferase
MREIFAIVRTDARAYMRHAADFASQGGGVLRLLSVLLTPPLLCSLLHRMAHALWCRDRHAASRCVARLNYRIHKAWISPDSRIGPGLYIPHTAGVVFDGIAGSDLTLFANALVGRTHAQPPARPHLGHDVIVGAFSVVSGGVTIGDGVRIGPGSVVETDVPAQSITVAKTAASSTFREPSA